MVIKKFIRLLFRIITFLSIILFISCNKEKKTEKKFCWQIVDGMGNKMQKICDKTETELLECFKNGACGSYNGGANLTSCNYYKIEGEKFCWQINNHYYKDMTENEILLISKCFTGNAFATKASCDSACENWYHREKRLYKPDSTITYSFVTKQNYCADTLATIYQGRQIIIKNDSDSLIVIQFSNNGSNW